MNLTDLPAETLHAIFDPLAQKDRKKLRLVCQKTKAIVPLHIRRLFISPNRTNLDVFKSVVAHDEFRSRVTEIIWDDARLEPYFEGPEVEATPYEKLMNDPFRKFAKAAGNDRWPGAERRVRERKAELWGEGTEAISLQESFRVYQTLYQEQEEIIKQGEDIDTLRLGLEKLPQVERLTITSETWRPMLLFPIYETPFFRSLPPGFRMPEPWPWSGRACDRNPTRSEEEALAEPWGDSSSDAWRGYHIVLSELVRSVSFHHVQELLVDIHREPTGICYQLFELPPSIEYINTLKFFEAVPLKRLDLALNVSGADEGGFGCFHNKLLQMALSKLTSLEHFHFHTNMVPDSPEFTADDDIHWVSMSDIFPKHLIATWPKLKHLGLANFFTRPDDVYDILANLPSIQTIDLDTIIFPLGSGMQRGLLHRIKEDLILSEDGPWVQSKPKITFRMPSGESMRRTTATNEITAFLYEGGECPFREHAPGFIDFPFGIVLDDFNPLYQMPHKLILDPEEEVAVRQMMKAAGEDPDEEVDDDEESEDSWLD